MSLGKGTNMYLSIGWATCSAAAALGHALLQGDKARRSRAESMLVLVIGFQEKKRKGCQFCLSNSPIKHSTLPVTQRERGRTEA